MAFRIIRNDIAKVKADVIVNTANPKPVIGAGTDSRIYSAAGEDDLLKERKKIGEIAPGEAVYTPAFRLDAKYIIHTVGPVWEGGNKGEEEILRRCYRNSMSLANELGARSIAFPLISSGSYGYPKDKALMTALDEIKGFLFDNEMDIRLVILDRKSLELSHDIEGDIESFISDSHASVVMEREYGIGTLREAKREEALRRRSMKNRTEELFMHSIQVHEKGVPALASLSLDDIVGRKEDTFQERLFRLIDESGMEDVEVYKKANVDRKLFSKIKGNRDYRPSKKTVLSFAIALGLDIDQTEDLLARAGLAFSPSSDADKIVYYAITKKQYNVYVIDAWLFKYGLSTLS
jgi:O-acetyl-ADP-ribose deacetylase (regulator of RNase III)